MVHAHKGHRRTLAHAPSPRARHVRQTGDGELNAREFALYTLYLRQTGDGEFTAKEFAETVEDDWREDAHGKDHLDKEGLFCSV